MGVGVRGPEGAEKEGILTDMYLHICMCLDYSNSNDDDMTTNETCFAKDKISRTPCHLMTTIATIILCLTP